jgi:protoporphyrinogen oxidase
LLPSTTVASVQESTEEVKVVTAAGKQEQFDHLVFTIPSSVIGKLLRIPSDAEAAWTRAPYLGVVVAGVVLKRELMPCYILNISDPQIELTGVIGMSNLVKDGSFQGRAFYYLPQYLLPQDPRWQRSEREWEEHFQRQLGKIFPDLRSSDVVNMVVSSARFVQSVPDALNQNRFPPRRPGTLRSWIINSAQCAHGPLFNDRVVKHADESVGTLLREIDSNGSGLRP